jgi:hypothetical protein
MKSLGLLFCAVVLIALGLGAQLPGTASAADLDCADFSSQAEAQENLLPGDPHGLDGDSDGVACEDNPCPCSTGTPTESGEPESAPSPPEPPPYRLSKGAARVESKRLAKMFDRRNPNVDALAFGGCSRLTIRHINCRLTAWGNTSIQRTTCKLRVAVRAKNRRPAARFISTRCRAKSNVRLRAGQAQDAIRARAAEMAGKPVALLFAERRDQRRFVGVAEWAQQSGIGAKEECTASIEVELTLNRELRVSVVEAGCEPAIFP